MTRIDLSKPVDTFRTAALRTDTAPRVHATAGKFGAGLLSGVAIITRGEALGHGQWIDQDFLQSVQTAINATGANGIKSRYTHPDDSGDGLGSLLGRATDATIDGDTVHADLHIAGTAHSTPDGNLASYVMDLAEEQPDAFGLSIAFQRDRQAETAFALAHGAEMVDTDWGPMLDLANFESPDPQNTRNLFHVRLKELRAVDAVDEPAANPQGLFRSRTLAPNEADALLAYATGRSTQRPTLSSFEVDPDRITNFLSRWLDRNGLAITPTEKHAMSDTPEQAVQPTSSDAGTQHSAGRTPDTAPAPTRDALLAEVRQELAKFTNRFGAENGTQWFNEGRSYAAALELHCDALAEQLAAREASIDELNGQLAAFKALGVEPVEQTAAPATKTGFKSRIRFAGEPAETN